jgi:hypothetical protein
MSRLMKVLLLVTVLSALLAPAWAQPVMPLPPCAPPCVALPAPPANLFHVNNKYYYYYGGVWYQSKRPMGPWGAVTKKLPAALYR